MSNSRAEGAVKIFSKILGVLTLTLTACTVHNPAVTLNLAGQERHDCRHETTWDLRGVGTVTAIEGVISHSGGSWAINETPAQWHVGESFDGIYRMLVTATACSLSATLTLSVQIDDSLWLDGEARW